MTTRSFFLFNLIFLFASVSCIRNYKPRLSQSLEGKVVPISRILDLKCVLKTGEKLDREVYRSDAQNFYLETHKGNKNYHPIKEGTIVYDGFDSNGNAEKGSINNFGYVSIESVEDKTDSQEEESEFLSRINCFNLISPQDNPLFIGRSHYNYNVRFQVIGNYVRVFIVAPAKDIPYQALSYSLKLNNDLYAMPIGGYDVKLGYIEEIVNSDWEATNVLILRGVPVKNKKDYTTNASSLGIVSSYPNKEDGTPVQHAEISGEFKPFETLLTSGRKQDVYPKSLFLGEWYYSQVAVKTNIAQRQFSLTGGANGYDNQLKEVSRVRIVLKDNFLVGYNSDIESINSDDVVSTNRDRWVFKIPIEHLDYWANSSGKDLNAGLNEVENNTQSIHKRPFIKVNFNKTDSPVFEYYKMSSRSLRMDKITFSENYLGFTLKDDVYQNTMRFSLLRVKKNPNYKPIYMTQEMYELFPAFANKKRFDRIERRIWSDNYQKSEPIQLFDLSKPIVYHFSNLSSTKESLRDIGRETINVWNQAFKKAGVSCPARGCIILDETKDVDLGDLRYNIFNLLNPDDIGAFGYLGYGPSLSDFETGEVISATSNIYLASYGKYLKSIVYNYIKSKGGLFSSFENNFTPIFQNISNRSFVSQNLRSKILSGFPVKKFFLPDYVVNSWSPEKKSYELGRGFSQGSQAVYGMDVKDGKINYFKSVKDILKTKQDREALFFKYYKIYGEKPPRDMGLDEVYESITHNQTASHECLLREGFVPKGNEAYKIIDKLCTRELEDIIDSNGYFIAKDKSPHQKIDWLIRKSKEQNFQNSISECADKIMPFISLRTAIHEMGHNLSLAHNFKGSVDKENTIPATEYEHKYILSKLNDREARLIKATSSVASSVMDYIGMDSLVLNPGGYDVAFLRLFYGGKLQTREGKMLTFDLSSEEGVHKFKKASKKGLKRYQVCNDYDLFFRGGQDIFCEVFDVGHTAEEIVVNLYQEYIADHFSNYGSGFTPSDRFSSTHVFRFINKTIGIYHQWRYEIAKHLKTDDPVYLTNISQEDYEKQVEELVSNKKNKTLTDLYKARNKIISTYMGLLFDVHDRYCVLKNNNKDGAFELVTFSELHNFLSQDLELNKDVSSCKDISGMLALSGRKFVDEIGLPLWPGRFETNPYPSRRVHYKYDHEGFLLSRLGGFFGLIVDAYSVQNDTLLGVMDEPDVRSLVHTKVLNRILKGVQVQHILPIDAQRATIAKRYFPLFSSEELLWNVTSFPLLARSVNPQDSMKSTQGFLDDFVVLSPISSNSNKYAGAEMLVYNAQRKAGGYLIAGHTEFSQFGTSMVLTSISGKQSSRSKNLIAGFRSNELQRSFVNATDLYDKNFSEGFYKGSFKSRNDHFAKYLKSVKQAMVDLYSNTNVYIPMLASINLFDSLEKTTNDNYSYRLIKYFQAGEVFRHEVQKEFNKECRALKINPCPEFHSITKNDEDDEDYKKLLTALDEIIDDKKSKMTSGDLELLDVIKRDGVVYTEINLIKSFVDNLYKNVTAESLHVTEKDTKDTIDITKYSDVIINLYAIDLFSDYESKTKIKISNLLDILLDHLDEKSKSELKNKMDTLKNNVSLISALKYFSRNRFVQEIFVRNVALYSSDNRFTYDSRTNFEQSSLFSEILSSGLEDVKSVMDIMIVAFTYMDIFPFYFEQRGDGERNKDIQLVTREIMKRPVSEDDENSLYLSDQYEIAINLYSALIANKSINQDLLPPSRDNVSNVMFNSFQEVISSIGFENDLSHLIEGNKDHSKLRHFFDTQTNKELISQYNIIYKSIHPSVFLHNYFGLDVENRIRQLTNHNLLGNSISEWQKVSSKKVSATIDYH